MKNTVYRVGLLLLGFVPLAVGHLVQYGVLTDQYRYYLRLPGYALLVVWFLFALLGSKYLKSIKQTMICLNAVAFLVLLLFCVQDMILDTDWSNPLGSNTLLFYSPLTLAFSLSSRWHHIFVMCKAFALLILASLLGCKIQKKYGNR